MSQIDSDDPEEHEAPVPKKRKFKSTLVDESAEDERPQTKRLRGNRGILKEMVEMPLDLLYEIFGRLDPIDLLHLARTTKELRGLLMSRSSVSAWKESRSNIDGLPDCPSDLSEPQYANLAFSKNCHFCLRNLSSNHICWEARLRTCSKCRDVEFQNLGNGRERGYPEELARRIPSIPIWTRSGYRDVYYLKLDSFFRTSYKKSKDKEKWLARNLKQRRRIDKHAEACALWHENMERANARNKLSLIQDGKNIIVERVKQLGWADELSKMNCDDIKPQDLPKVAKACQKELTERVLSNLEKHLVEHMEGLKRSRLQRERYALLKDRLPILKEVYETYTSSLPVNSVFPSTTEIFRDPIVREVVDNTTSAAFTKDDFEGIIPLLPHIALRRQRKIEDNLCKLITDASGVEYTFDPKTVLHLATTSFSCTSHWYLRYPRALVHSCANAGGRDCAILGLDADGKACWDILHQRYWNSPSPRDLLGPISFKPADWKLLVEIVHMCELDPKTTTALEMDERNPILECIPCNDMRKGRATLNWTAVIAHKHRVHSESAMELALIEDQEAQFVRARMTEEQERQNGGAYCKDMICVHCKEKGNTIDLMRHAIRDHGIPKPTREDVATLIDCDQIPALCYLWPPRIEALKKKVELKSDGVSEPSASKVRKRQVQSELEWSEDSENGPET